LNFNSNTNDTMNIENIDDFKKHSHLDGELLQAVIDQLGGWYPGIDNTLQDIANHGIDGGFHGFIYHTDTVPFAQKHRALITALAESQADDFGRGVIETVQNFNCLVDKRDGQRTPDYTQAEVGQCLYGDGDDTQIMNALAWYAAEEVARSYTDLIEG